MLELTPEGRQAVEDIARRHGVGTEAVLTLLRALAAGGGGMAQFSHPELGGMGQWTAGGMVMVGDMFNHDLKRRVDALCSELAALLREGRLGTVGAAPGQSQSQGGPTAAPAGAWWPAGLGVPDAAGAQDGLRYAYFRAANRLAIQQDGRVTLHDTTGHAIGGVSQQQGGTRSLAFTSQHGPVRLEDLPVLGPATGGAPEPPPAAPAVPVAQPGNDPLALIERLAELRQKGILSEEEFAAKKAELLSRL